MSALPQIPAAADFAGALPAERRVLGGGLAAIATMTMVWNAGFFEQVTSSHLLLVVALLYVAHVLLVPRLLFVREAAIYAAFFVYGCVTTLWTPDVALADNSLSPMLNFLLLTVLFGSLTAYYGARAIIAGSLLGFVIASGVYSLSTGFPFAVPESFSYNGVAVMYQFGLFLTVAYAIVTGRKLLPLLLAVIFMVQVAATTSIKMNLGIVLGALAAAFINARQVGRMVRANALTLVILGGVITYGILSNPAIVDRLEYGMARLAVGVEVLQAREDVQGYSGFGERMSWARDTGVAFLKNPVFGRGVEAFRYDHGVTSHSSPVDLAYNMGLIGIVLFYSLFASLLAKAFAPAVNDRRALRALILALVVCSVFVSLSGTYFYNSFLAASVGICTAMLRAPREEKIEDRKAP
jgi:hypothetical protein